MRRLLVGGRDTLSLMRSQQSKINKKTNGQNQVPPTFFLIQFHLDQWRAVVL